MVNNSLKHLTKLYSQIIIFFTVFFSLSINIGIINVTFVFIFLLFNYLVIFLLKIINENNIRFNIYDFLLLFSLLYVYLNRNTSYPVFTIAFLFLGILLSLVVRTNISIYKAAFLGILSFSFLNLILNFISILAPNFNNLILYTLKINVFIDSLSAYNLTGLMSDIGRNANILVILLFILISYGLVYKKNKIFNYSLILISFLLLLGTGKLAHNLFFLMTLIFFYFLLKKDLFKSFFSILLLSFIGIFFIFIVINVFPNSISVVTRTLAKIDSGDVTSGRLFLWEIAIQIFLKNPIFGIGYGGFMMNSYSLTGIAIYAGVHNDYLQWLAEGGIIGFLINLFLTLIPFYFVIKLVRKNIFVKSLDPFIKFLIYWSFYFQLFVILYSFSGIPRYSYETNNLYLLACSIPISIKINHLSFKIKTKVFL
jgi:O-antigen ligase